MDVETGRTVTNNPKTMHLPARKKNRVTGSGDVGTRSIRELHLTLENVKSLVFPIMDVGWDKAARVPEHFDE
jgi:hypothetical protein